MERKNIPPAPWKSEKLFFDGDSYFRALLASIRRARESVDLETYIFTHDALGNRVLRELSAALRRGVKVRLLVDYVGSPDFEEAYGSRLRRMGLPYQVYRPWGYLWERILRSRWGGFFGPLRGAWHAWVSVNHRDHRKLCLIDGTEAWLGSFNVAANHLRSLVGKAQWRDTGIRLGGLRTPVFRYAFLSAWYDRIRPGRRRAFRHILARAFQEDPYPPSVLLNSGQFLRRLLQRRWAQRLKDARRRIWLTSAYFVPTGRMLRALVGAARRGVDVRLILPGQSDVPMVRLASHALYGRLLAAGARIHEYQGGVLHAKTLLADDWALVGSSNFDHRSALHDLEINVTPLFPASRRALERRFRTDLALSRRITREELWESPPWSRFLSWILFHFRHWL
jgi:cardiolipin synthase A/B